MTLQLIILLPLLGGIVAWISERRGSSDVRWIALITLAADFALLLSVWAGHPAAAGASRVLLDENLPWIPQLGIGFHLSMDGLSLLMALLTVFLGAIAVLVSWTEIRERIGAFHFHLLACLTGILGVFLSADLFLFFVFYEVMLIPMYFLIVFWGEDAKGRVAAKFVMYTQAGGLLMLVSILGLYFAEGSGHTFDYNRLLATRAGASSALLMLGFFLAFGVKLPIIPLHGWQAETYSAAPTAGGIILSGLMAKAGAYGLIRFAIPLFPDAAHRFAPCAMGFGVIAILYGGLLAFSQTDLKRFIAYSSISHLGFVVLGAFAMNATAYQGVVMQMICHGLSVAGLFILAAVLRDNAGTNDIERLGGLWHSAPRLGVTGSLLAMATLGLPGLGNFIGEFLILLGVYKVSVTYAAIGAFGAVASTIYALWLVQRIFLGPRREGASIRDISGRSLVAAAALIAALLWLGLYPQPVLQRAEPSPRAVMGTPASDNSFELHPRILARALELPRE
ncbi:MAG: NADH-quinone oxidoreductase subunit M [Candidatus Hydrogenedentes bacterium]|nr:NADH-quinone oxidoreductase subunit M [Candidatus Hydrogenedentota bacterium]